MSYDQPTRQTYVIPAANLAAAATRVFRGPKGRRGQVANVDVAVTASIVAPTTTPRVQVGTGANPLAYFDADLGLTAAGSSFDAEQVDTAAKNVFKKDVQMAKPLMPPDTDFQLGVVAGTGAGAAGTGDVTVVINWI